MDKEEELNSYNRGFMSGKQHSVPSSQTIKFMSEINQEIKFIKEKLVKMPTTVEMELANEKMVQRIFSEANKRYASKLTERIVFGMVGFILTSVLISLLYLILK